ncbi:hypothetical protein BDY21DRAFT_287343 [Lineolata rhizophorae]|uniref:Prokaryotic-type class I peptide chain release factors domain-containing protein n=1 Tax=Lineolata rhizophorae TaxID=578093 RepID=A0A6A6NZE8_9PEZI|nr:hypothetical protein BDY21DRAFT_287343 [Lineolata rhizophorae]
MFGAPWVCRRCLFCATGLMRRRNLRFQSTAASDEIVSPALLGRARSVSAEHSRLTQELAESFNTKTARRIGEISSVANAFADWEKATDSLTELHSLLADPTTDAELRSLASSDVDSAQTALRAAGSALTTALVPAHPFASLPCLIEVRPAAGGSEAALFAGELVRMYMALSNRLGWPAALLSVTHADVSTTGGGGSDDAAGALAEAVLEIKRAGAYDALRGEAGVHRVQRVPATEKNGRVHTSTATVMVLPSFPEHGTGNDEVNFEDPNSDYYVDPREVRVDIMRARGAGGQHVNTTDSAVRLTHEPTGIVVSMQDARSQHRNREKAWHILRGRLAAARREAREEEALRLRRSVVGVAKTGRNDKVRTYNYGQRRVTDHRSGFTVHDLDGVIEGGEALQRVMESVKAWLMDQEIKAMVSEEEAKK